MHTTEILREYQGVSREFASLKHPLGFLELDRLGIYVSGGIAVVVGDSAHLLAGYNQPPENNMDLARKFLEENPLIEVIADGCVVMQKREGAFYIYPNESPSDIDLTPIFNGDEGIMLETILHLSDDVSTRDSALTLMFGGEVLFKGFKSLSTNYLYGQGGPGLIRAYLHAREAFSRFELMKSGDYGIKGKQRQIPILGKPEQKDKKEEALRRILWE